MRALSTCLTKLSSLKCVDSVANAFSVTCKLHPTGFKVNATDGAQCIFIAETLKVFQPFSPKTVRHLFGWWINIDHTMVSPAPLFVTLGGLQNKSVSVLFIFSLLQPFAFPAVVSSLSPNSGKQWLSDLTANINQSKIYIECKDEIMERLIERQTGHRNSTQKEGT